MKKSIISALIFAGFSSVLFASLPNGNASQPASNQLNKSLQLGAAKAVLKRVLGEKERFITLQISEPSYTKSTYQYVCSNGVLKVTASNATSLTRAVYDYLRSNQLGMLGWEGPLFRLPNVLPQASETSLTSPFNIRHAYNVVTAGYTTPYWDWARWEKELDWQAMHGFNMLMAPVATEAIATRVWKKLGLTQQEIDEFYVGPAHLPWQRMGNICQVGGTLPAEWHTDQIALQKKILKRMRQLGIKPVVQSFAGFVPKALKRIYPNIILHNTLWNSGFTTAQRPVILMPGDPLFAKITKMYMEEWQKEFGAEDYFLVDSFNEMELPETERPVTELLAEYGEKTYEAIKAGNPNAVWVIQGWMFGYQRHIWSPERVKALFSKVPDNQILILDYANDYANSWEPVNGFNGKQWAYGFVPNMGGKTAYTGDMALYATGAASILASPKKNNLTGFTISGEGLENNEVLYEIMTDAAWSEQPIELNAWLKNYSINKYGESSDAISQSWQLLQNSCYKSLEPHPSMGWQLGRCGNGSVNRDADFFKSTQLFLTDAERLQSSVGYSADAIERVAIALGLKADEWFKIAATAYEVQNYELGDKAGDRGLELLTELDRLMESHPLNRLDRWLNLSQAHSKNAQLNQFYENNARRIITVWGPPVNDYSCRIWSGLVRDFYKPRMQQILLSLKTSKPFDRKQFEANWVESSGISTVEKYTQPVVEAKKLFQKATTETLPQIKMPVGEVIGNWNNVPTTWTELEYSLSSSQLKQLKGIGFVFTSGNSRLDIREVKILADGKEVAVIKRDGYAGTPSRQNYYFFELPVNVTANNTCVVKAMVKRHDGTNSIGRIELILK